MVQATPPTWDEHASHLRDRQHDSPPRKGVAARRRTARAPPAAPTLAPREFPRTPNGNRHRPSRRAAQQSGFASHIHGPGSTGKEWKLVASIRELHRVAAAHGYVKTVCFIRPLSSTTSPTAGMCRTQAPATGRPAGGLPSGVRRTPMAAPLPAGAGAGGARPTEQWQPPSLKKARQPVTGSPLSSYAGCR